MKKVLALLMVAGMFSLVACGPSEEEKAAAEKAKHEKKEDEATAEHE
jgi:protein involved in sex pheromone biosynthesis